MHWVSIQLTLNKHRNNRNRISKDVENKILEIRDESKNIWGKAKIAVALERDYEVKINPTFAF